MRNAAKATESVGVEDVSGADAILRKMAKRGLADLQVRHVSSVASEEPSGEDAMQRLIQSNFLRAARLRRSRDVTGGAASQ